MGKDKEAVVSLDERRLLTRHCRGDETAFAELVAAYRAPVYSYLVRCGVDPASRDDLLQDIFLKIHNAAASYAPERSLKPWVFTIVANTVRSHYRKIRVRELVFPDRATPPEVPDGKPNSEDLAEAHQTAAWMESAINVLSFNKREVLLLICIERMSVKEVASVLETPVNTVKTLLRRARMELADALAKRNARAAWESER